MQLTNSVTRITIFLISLSIGELSFGSKEIPRILPEKIIKKNNSNASSYSRRRGAVKKTTFVKQTREPIIFDIPITYNKPVQKWIRFFQTSGRPQFTRWLSRSTKYLPFIRRILEREGLPLDLAYISMIESGFSSSAVSSAAAVGPWQFIKETGVRYGLSVNWWIDERRDFYKSTVAATKYLKKLHSMFGVWYLAAAGYNTGENRVKRLVQKYKTKDFWELTKKRGFVKETQNYIPKLMAAVLISKAPALYGFRNIKFQKEVEFEYFEVPGGTRLTSIADYLGVTRYMLKQLNPELIRGYIPSTVSGHRIRIPKGSSLKMASFIRKTVALNK